MAETKEERWQYTDKRITIEGQTFDVTLAFPVPDSEKETVTDKINTLSTAKKLAERLDFQTELCYHCGAPIRFDSEQLVRKRRNICNNQTRIH